MQAYCGFHVHYDVLMEIFFFFWLGYINVIMVPFNAAFDRSENVVFEMLNVNKYKLKERKILV